ncbi:MAG TPA: UvrB/UvrC motif-containing protein [Phycisphaerales bacterium]|nr:UvrB/UvrC motif-containing protein [Phycisphaerales bacterium]HRQ74657.1 UvrB/UvrC motif-containing protein [Phycisphaerales bacterium]
MSDSDLTDLLNSWPYEPGSIKARRIIGTDGRTKLQVRIELGVLQMEVLGRPDGLTPHGFPSLLEYHRDRLERYSTHGGASAGFVLSSSECAELREEAIQFYHRYVAFFALREFSAVVSDTQRNIEVFDLCRDFGETETDRTVLEQFRPQVLVMRIRAQAEQAVAEGDPKRAIAALDQGLAELRAVFTEAGLDDEFDTANETQLLRGMRDVLVPKLPSSQRAELQERLRAALAAENYELAAILRDELKML